MTFFIPSVSSFSHLSSWPLVGGWRWHSYHTRLDLNHLATPRFPFFGVESFVDVFRNHVLYANQAGGFTTGVIGGDIAVDLSQLASY
jgi:hypothetical protein